jgi:orotidine-5'-phosphate decarboxylase
MQAFVDRLIEQIALKESCAVVGLDPQLELLPPALLEPIYQKYGHTLESAGRAAEEFCRRVVDVVAPHVTAVKLQLGCFERLGWMGMKACADTIRHAQEKGLLVILDGKRADVGVTAQAYAEGYLGEVAVAEVPQTPWGADAITVNPYLGWDGIQPFVEVAKEHGKGVFVLVKTSNLSSGQVQDLVAEGRPVYAHLAGLISSWAEELMGTHGYSSLGAVVAATFPRDAARIRTLMPRSYFLVPGYGAQGGTAQDVIPSFNPDGTGAIINSSRAVIYAYYQPPYAEEFGPERWEEAVESAVIAMNDDINSALAQHYPQPGRRGADDLRTGSVT